MRLLGGRATRRLRSRLPGGYALKLADVERGQAMLIGTIREGDEPTVLVARLGLAQREVNEIETLVIRDRAVAERLDEIRTPRSPPVLCRKIGGLNPSKRDSSP